MWYRTVWGLVDEGLLFCWSVFSQSRPQSVFSQCRPPHNDMLGGNPSWDSCGRAGGLNDCQQCPVVLNIIGTPGGRMRCPMALVFMGCNRRLQSTGQMSHSVQGKSHVTSTIWIWT